jgi:hypothetical protein
MAAAVAPSALAAEAGKIWRGPIIDAHSQVDHLVNLERIVPLMDKAGVARILLSARGYLKHWQIAEFARAHSDRVVASFRTKGRVYADNHPNYYKLLRAQQAISEFAAMAEIILWHAAKGNVAPKWVIPVSSPQVQAALEIAFQSGWPVVLHYEFAAAGDAGAGLMQELEGLLRAHPRHPFLLTHMGQIDLADTRRLIEAHPNVHFIPSWSNSITAGISSQPWVNLFEGRHLKPGWKALITAHPARFVLGFDNVFARHWGDQYVAQVKLWREALAELPDAVAHAVSHRNAEKLWKLDPLQ